MRIGGSIQVSKHTCAGRGAVGPPQLESMGLVVSTEVQSISERSKNIAVIPERTIGLNKARPGFGAVGFPNLWHIGSVIPPEVERPVKSNDTWIVCGDLTVALPFSTRSIRRSDIPYESRARMGTVGFPELRTVCAIISGEVEGIAQCGEIVRIRTLAESEILHYLSTRTIARDFPEPRARRHTARGHIERIAKNIETFVRGNVFSLVERHHDGARLGAVGLPEMDRTPILHSEVQGMIERGKMAHMRPIFPFQKSFYAHDGRWRKERLQEILLRRSGGICRGCSRLYHRSGYRRRRGARARRYGRRSGYHRWYSRPAGREESAHDQSEEDTERHR